MNDLLMGLIIGVIGTVFTMGMGILGGIYIACKLQQKGHIFSGKNNEKSESGWKKINTRVRSNQNNTNNSSSQSKSSISSTTKSIKTN